MENILERDNSETLLLTKHVFSILLNKVITHFKESHKIDGKYKDSQLYGFGNYDLEKANLKNDLELVLRGYVNGKYLYNKYREASSGKPIIKISREYRSLFFNYLGYRDVSEFVESGLFTTKQRDKQFDLLRRKGNSIDHYYVCYYFGEDNKMNKGQVIIYNDWKTVEMIYVYVDENGAKGVYTFYGTINQSEDFAHFDTKYFVGNKKSEGAKFIFFIGKSSPNERHYLIGTYSGFDKYDRAIAGKMILKKYNAKLEIEEEVNSKLFDPIICQELNKVRLVVESNIRKNPLRFSKKSPYAQILSKTAGDYAFEFNIEGRNHCLKLRIETYHHNIVSLNDSIIVEDDKVVVLNKGQILNLDFAISGVFHLQKTSIYINAMDFIGKNKEVEGNFNGIDINNKIVSGIVKISRLY
ncbi:hypothetical protein [Flagellimonas pacifica]|uniref:Uncharacterized protein n=1 Tax=Flagellimonas pacifica TaxID=1247520 RepID=A0A285MFS0_9FLAO|nr:hypothetical protein [Allomuricauda parva]SNY95317.1 hypothetical protein SAMN06265377_0985 [Allomuricauda parva]